MSRALFLLARVIADAVLKGLEKIIDVKKIG
jgi:hypothetical protein